MRKTRRHTQLDPVQLARREDIFRLYRDMGPTRNYDRLLAAIEAKHGSLSKRTLANWSQQHSWQARVADYDRDLTKGFQIQADDLDPNFDWRDALLKAAHLALLRVLQSNPVVRTPQDAKALIDAANNAIKLVELRGANDVDRKSGSESRKRMFEILQSIEARIREAGRPKPQTIDGKAVMVTDLALPTLLQVKLKIT
jgi:hypothetical protein